MAGREIGVQWRGRTVRAWLPDLLGDDALSPTDPRTIAAAERARLAVLTADTHTPIEWEPLARLLLRAEGIASSYIEGVRASAPEVVVAQLEPTAASGAAAWVAANLVVLDAAIDHAHTDERLTATTLHRWHVTLMTGHTSLDSRLVGAFRDELDWIGGATPLDAALVTAPPDRIGALMYDVLEYVNRTDLDPVAQAAVSHAQFEIIHPYGDGNGRLGRVLIQWILARRTGVRVLPPISTTIAADPGGYLAEMTLFRIGTADSWIRWFADTLTRSAGRVDATMSALAALSATWQERLNDAGIRSDAGARRLLDELPRTPVLTSQTVAELLGVSERSGRTALDTLAQAGIVAPFTTADGRTPVANRYRWWYAPDAASVLAAV